MKLYDFDGMFDEKLSEYIKRNPRGYTEKQWEDVIPEMYAKFGDTVIKSIGKTPNEFYAQQSDEQLVKSLTAHLKQGVPVSEFLCNAIESRHMDELLIPLLKGSDDEISYALNLLGASEKAMPEYMRLITTSESEDVRNTCVDYAKLNADLVKDEALSLYEKGVSPEYMLEILSRCTARDEKIFNALVKAFRTDDENTALHASFLAAYGDERALEYLYDKIEEDGITYADFQEIKFAIEELGGTYEKERDFSSDPYYQLIKSHGAMDIDIFKDIK